MTGLIATGMSSRISSVKANSKSEYTGWQYPENDLEILGLMGAPARFFGRLPSFWGFWKWYRRHPEGEGLSTGNYLARVGPFTRFLTKRL